MAGFTYFELHTQDLPKAKAFYGEMFNWTFEDMQGGAYSMVNMGGAGGGMMKSEDAKAMWLSYITVPNVKDAATKAQRLGAKVLQGQTEVPGRGSFVVISDPAGAPIALWQEAAKG